jgi:hypothetical protein
MATRIQGRAVRREGELLEEIEASKGGRPQKTSRVAPTGFGRFANTYRPAVRGRARARDGTRRDAWANAHRIVVEKDASSRSRGKEEHRAGATSAAGGVAAVGEPVQRTHLRSSRNNLKTPE